MADKEAETKPMLQALPDTAPRTTIASHPDLWDAYAGAYTSEVLRMLQCGEQSRETLIQGIRRGDGVTLAEHRQFIYTAVYLLTRGGQAVARCRSRDGVILETIHMPGGS